MIKIKSINILTIIILLSFIKINYSQSLDICGMPGLTSIDLKTIYNNTKRLYPDVYRKAMENSLNYPSSVNGDSIGTVRQFYVYNYLQQAFYVVNAKLVSKGNVSQIWVELSDLNAGTVNQNDINSMYNSLEINTPSGSRDPNLGIISLVKQLFGDPPDKDGDGITDFLLVDIHDASDTNITSPHVAGFFNSYDQSNAEFSNKRDILYIDTWPTLYYNGNHTPSAANKTIAHEFQHLVHYNYDKNELTFVNEGLSENASVVCGYPLRSTSLYFKNTNIPLFNWNSEVNGKEVLADYSRAALFTLYYIEQLGDNFIKQMVQDTLNGIKSFNHLFMTNNYAYRFNEVFYNFVLANYLNNKKFGNEFYYKYNITEKPKTLFNSKETNGTVDRQTLYPYATDYLSYTSGGTNLQVNLYANSDILGSALLFGSDTSMNVSLLLDRNATYTGFGTTYKTIVFPIANTSENELPYIFKTTATDTTTFWIKLNGPVTSSTTYNAEITALTIDKNNVIFAGVKNGTLWKSTDNGDSWTKIFENPFAGFDYGISSLAVDSNNVLYVGTQDKFIFKSTDSGNSFTHLVNYDNDTLWNITKIFYKKSNNTLFALSGSPYYSSSELFKSTNSGNNWSLVVDTVGIYDLYLAANGNLYAVGSNNISYSADNGAHWTTKINNDQVSYFTGTCSIFDKNTNSIIFGTWNNGIMKYDLSLQRFSKIGMGLGYYEPFYNLLYKDSQDNFYIAPAGSGIYKTKNGNYWGNFNFGELDSKDINVIVEDKNGILYVGTTNNGVYRARESTLTNVNPEINLVNEFRLFNNYPNPFNPSTLIEFEIPQTLQTELAVYNILGQKVLEPINKVLTRGKHFAHINMSNFASGIYIARLKAGRFTKSIKMLLLK